MKLIQALLLLTVPFAASAQVSIEQVQSCLMSVTAQTLLTPQQEAHRKVVCYEGTRGLSDDCERSVAATMRLPSNTESHYKAQCRRVSPN